METYLNKPEVQKALHANTTNLNHSYKQCSSSEYCQFPWPVDSSDFQIWCWIALTNILVTALGLLIWLTRCVRVKTLIVLRGQDEIRLRGSWFHSDTSACSVLHYSLSNYTLDILPTIGELIRHDLRILVYRYVSDMFTDERALGFERFEMEFSNAFSFFPICRNSVRLRSFESYLERRIWNLLGWRVWPLLVQRRCGSGGSIYRNENKHQWSCKEFETETHGGLHRLVSPETGKTHLSCSHPAMNQMASWFEPRWCRQVFGLVQW